MQSKYYVASALTHLLALSFHKYLHANHLLGAKVRKRSKTQLLPPRHSRSLGRDLGRASVTIQSEESWDGDMASEGRGFPAAHGRPCSGGQLQGPAQALWGPGSLNENPGCPCGRERRVQLTANSPGSGHFTRGLRQASESADRCCFGNLMTQRDVKTTTSPKAHF